VRAEAGTAKAEKKLIPVKTSELSYRDIPLPFGEMHTENISSLDLIRAAIVAQLAKPALPQSPFWQIASTFKYEFLTWVGIVGTAITVFGGASTIFNLADWARELVKHWREWNQIIWSWMFSMMNVEVPSEVIPMMSFVVFTVILFIGGHLSFRRADRSTNVTPTIRRTIIFAGAIILFLIGRLIVADTLNIWFVSQHEWASRYFDFSDPDRVEIILRVIAITVMMTWSVIILLVSLLLISYEWPWVVINSLLFMFVGACLLIAPVARGLIGEIGKTGEPVGWHARVDSDVLYLSMILFQICWTTLILFSRLQPLTRRLGFVVLGVLTLIGLSEISQLHLQQYLHPTKVSYKSVLKRLPIIWKHTPHASSNSRILEH
jgi:hypothetical protein